MDPSAIAANASGPDPANLVSKPACWSAFAVNSTNPPSAAIASGVTIQTRISGHKVEAAFQVRPVVVAPLASRSWVQIGAMCEP